MKTLIANSTVAVSMIMASILAAVPALAWSADCEYSREIKREVNLTEARKLNVVAGAGALEIKGDKSRETVSIDARLCASEESQLADMDVSSEFKGDVMYLKTEFAKDKLWSTGKNNVYIDLTVYVPVTAELDVTDSSGEARIKEVKSLTMVDSSGELKIKDVAGDVRVIDSSGALKIKDIAGSVWVTDSSGAIEVRGVTGDFTVEVDSSGPIEAESVSGNVLVKTDSSGAIDVKDVGGNFTVGNDSSGGIYYKNVAGEVRLPE